MRSEGTDSTFDALQVPARPNERWTRFVARVAQAFGLVLLLLVATYVLASLVSYRGWGGVALATLAAACATVALISAESGAALVRAASVLGVLAVALALVAALAGTSTPSALSALLVAVLLVMAAAKVLLAVVTEREVGFRTILGAISVYVILGLLFSFVYAAIDRLQPGPFFETSSRTGDIVFFSITTLTTTGYGNLVPADHPGRLLSGLEMLTGQIFLVTLIAGLVSLWRPGSGLAHARQRRE